jgi:hypothetical protein
VPLLTYRTLADTAGAWPEYVIIALTAAGLVTVLVRGRRARG